MECEHKEVKRVVNASGGIAKKVCAHCDKELDDDVETSWSLITGDTGFFWAIHKQNSHDFSSQDF